MIINIREINKSFGKIKVLDKISFDIKKQEIFGILGLNGAGKTTLLRCLVNFFSPQSGNVYFKDRIITDKDIHERIGYLPEDFQPPFHLSAEELLTFLGSTLKSRISTETCLKWVGLFAERKKRIGMYSRGMIQRLGIAMALLKDPEVLVLDEPILGLDLIGQKQIFSLMQELNNQGKTIILSTHIFPHIESFCHRIGIINKGTLKFVGRLQELMARHDVLTLEEAFLKEIGAGNGVRNLKI